MSGPIYRFEDFELDARERAIYRRGSPCTVTPKAFDVLLALVERHVSLVGKDELLTLVWAGTFVEETNLTYTISLLRKALADSPEKSKFIETVPKRGYRFVATVTTHSAGDSPPTMDSPATVVEPGESDVSLVLRERAAEPEPWQEGAPKSVRTLWSGVGRSAVIGSAIALCLVFVLIYFGGRLVLPQPRRTIEARNVVPFTSFPGGEYEPAFSPDGGRLAFVWKAPGEANYDIYVKTVSSGAVTRVTTNAAGHGSPTWSPDGAWLAFVQYSPVQDDNGIFIVAAAGGIARRLSWVHPLNNLFDSHLDWAPNGKYLAVVDKRSDAEPCSIFLVTVDTGEKRRLTFPPKESLGDTGPRFTTSDTIVFRRTVNSGVNELYSSRIDREAGAATRLTFGNGFIQSHAWMPDGRGLIFSDARGFWRLPFAGAKPTAVPGLPGGANYIAVSKQSNRIAFSQWSADTNVWRIPLGTGGGGATSLIESTRDERSAQYSPDGSMIAFRSDRSGSSEIWLCDAQGRNPVQLTSMAGPLTGTPRWSPDGLQIAFDSRPEGNADIYVVRIASGAVRRITHGPAANVVPSWSSDGRVIYFSSNRTGSWQVWKVSSSSTGNEGAPEQVTHGGGFAPIESPDRKTLYYAKGPDADGLWQVPVIGGRESTVIPQLKTGYWGYWAPVPGKIYFIDNGGADAAAVYSYSIETGRTAKTVSLPSAPPFGDSGFSVSPDSHFIIYSRVDRSVSDIMLAETN